MDVVQLKNKCLSFDKEDSRQLFLCVSSMESRLAIVFACSAIAIISAKNVYQSTIKAT
jgi:hypothetical protein